MRKRAISRIGVIGSGYVCRRFLGTLERTPDLAPSKVLTRTKASAYRGFPHQDLLTNSLDELIDTSDVMLECTGDAIRATDVIGRIAESGKPVVTLNSEFQVVAGSYFADKLPLAEAEGDQPGSLAALRDDVVDMGFEPLVYGNMKGFLNHDPTPEDMTYWASRNGISVPMVTAFTDGTKLQLEQALVANGCGATIARPGLVGLD